MSHWQGLVVIGRGRRRVCVVDPLDPGQCLKYELAHAPTAGERLRGWLRPALRGGANALEWRQWQRLQARLGEAADRHFAPVLGWRDTAQGRALVCRRLLDGDRPAPSLAEVMAARALPAGALLAALDDFVATLLPPAIPLFDLNPGNLHLLAAGGRPRLACVDLKSLAHPKALLPLADRVPALARAKLRRRAARLAARIRAA